MSDERIPADVQSLWQGQPGTGGAMSVDELRRRSRYVERRVGRRNLREYVAAAFMVLMFGWLAWIVPSPVLRVGNGLAVAAAVFIVYHLHSRGAARTMPADMALTSCLAFYRGELVRQRDLLRGAWKWGLLPLVPSLAVLMAGHFQAHPEGPLGIVLTTTGFLMFFVLVGELNRRAANKIQARIDALERNE